jgi:hypothetical protein
LAPEHIFFILAKIEAVSPQKRIRARENKLFCCFYAMNEDSRVTRRVCEKMPKM